MNRHAALIVLVLIMGVSHAAPLRDNPGPTKSVWEKIIFRALRAERKGTLVQLQWTTERELNAQGYQVQKFTGSEWLNVGFVPALSAQNISATQRNYTFTDFSAGAGNLQYRVVQQGTDNTQAYSHTLQVGAQGAAPAAIIYPNPSRGNFNIVLDAGMGLQNIFLSDVGGRMVAIYREAAQSVAVKDLKAGTYILRIVDAKTGRQLTEKVVVQ